MSIEIQKARVLEKALPSSRRRTMVLLTGARQTGKTTLARSAYPGLRYINLDAPENRELIRSVATPFWGRDVGNAILDEGQKEPSLFEKVKYAFDERSISFTVILGSSQILLLKRIRETLAGRVALYELWPLMLSEIPEKPSAAPCLLDHLLGNSLPDSVLKRTPSVLLDREAAYARDAGQHLLQWGGMPALLPLPEEERWKWLRDYEYTYLERDLGDLARLDDLMPFRKFQRLAALRTGRLLNYSELARDTGLGTDTARRYLEYLRLSYQVFLLQPFHRNLTSTVVKTPKLHWVDTGLARSIGGIRTGLTGELYESAVVAEAMKRIRTRQIDADLYFYRTRSGLELDLLIETPDGILGVEAKMTAKPGPADARAMRDVASALGKSWRGGLLVYQGDEIRPLADPRIWAVPFHRLFY